MDCCNFFFLTATLPAMGQAVNNTIDNDSTPEGWVRVAATNIEIGGVLSGRLNRSDAIVEGNYIEAFRFAVEENMPIQVQVLGNLSDRSDRRPFLPVVLLFDPANRLIARAEVDAGTATSYIIFQATASGNYTAFVTGAATGAPGRFSITVLNANPEGLSEFILPKVSGASQPEQTNKQVK
jgi:hypothetical protein